jgi:hypothetical protein
LSARQFGQSTRSPSTVLDASRVTPFRDPRKPAPASLVSTAV